MLVQIAVCKCRHSDFTPGGAEMDEQDGGIRVECDPTYTEIGIAGGCTLQLKENEAYACSK